MRRRGVSGLSWVARRKLAGATGVAGPTGPARVFDRQSVLDDGEFYAFSLDGRDFYARVRLNGVTGRLELVEIPDPWICEVCDRGYQQGLHTEFGHAGTDAHSFAPRGDFTKTEEGAGDGGS